MYSQGIVKGSKRLVFAYILQTGWTTGHAARGRVVLIRCHIAIERHVGGPPAGPSVGVLAWSCLLGPLVDEIAAEEVLVDNSAAVDVALVRTNLGLEGWKCKPGRKVEPGECQCLP